MVNRVVLSDANPRLIGFHRALRDDLDGLLKALDALPRDDWRERYYEMRDRYNQGPHEGVEHAARFLWLNRAGFNGLYRENRRGEYNVPRGSYKVLALPSPEHMRTVADLLQGVELHACSFEELLPRVGPSDHVYCDPPYVPLSPTASFTGYCATRFGSQEQHMLATMAHEAALRGAHVVLSNHDVPMVRDELYTAGRGFEFVARPSVTRTISRRAATRRRVGEVIASIDPLSVGVAA
jgi:DNA adenine methylase